jgi:3-phenylpropionate/trans-cinnamate dioxygenase ferredoxin reductase subunit
MGIDRTRRHVEISDGESLPYHKVVLATGGRPRLLPISGADRAENLHYLRTIADVERIQKYFIPKARLIIVGGGYIGLEVAAVAVKRGLQVTVLESAPRVLIRVTSPEMSAFYQDVHRRAGVQIRTDAIIEELHMEGDRVTGIRLAGNESIPADCVIVGIGLVPNVELAAAAGLIVENGIVVDDRARTSDADIFAIGDCSYHPNDHYGRHVRLESVPNATEQALNVAAAIMDKPIPPTGLPWFWSDQYNLKLQMAGLSQGFDQTVHRGPVDPAGFLMFYLREGAVIAVDAVNRPKDFMASKQLIAAKLRVAPEQLADPAVSILDLVKKA